MSVGDVLPRTGLAPHVWRWDDGERGCQECGRREIRVMPGNPGVWAQVCFPAGVEDMSAACYEGGGHRG